MPTQKQRTAEAGSRLVNNYCDGIPARGNQALLFLLVMTAYFIQQFNNWNFGFIAPALAESWGLKPPDIARIVFWYFIGMTAGGFLGGLAADRIGRRPAFLAGLVILSASSLATTFADNLFFFTLTRACTGFGVFAMMVVSTAYIAEVAPAESRGRWQSLIAAVGFCAAPLAALVCRLVVPMGPEAWRYIFCFGGLGLVPFFLGAIYLKESPRWLVNQGRIRDAEFVTRWMTGRDIDLSEAAKRARRGVDWKTQLFGMFSGRYLKRTLVLILLFAGLTPASFLLMVWTPQLLRMQNFSLEQTLTISTVITIGVPMGCFLGALVADHGGRKFPLAVFLSLSALSTLLFALVSNPILLAVFGFFVTAFYMAASFILFSYAAESYPTRMRGACAGVNHGLGRLAVSATQPLIPLIHTAYGFFGIFMAVAVLFFLPVVPLLLWGLHTAGKSLESLE